MLKNRREIRRGFIEFPPWNRAASCVIVASCKPFDDENFAEGPLVRADKTRSAQRLRPSPCALDAGSIITQEGLFFVDISDYED